MLSQLAPEFSINDQEANQLATAWGAYLSHGKYKVSKKTQHLLELLAVLGTIEFPRFVALNMRRTAQRAAAKVAAGGAAQAGYPNVVGLDGRPAGA
jgi:hypothetical protein